MVEAATPQTLTGTCARCGQSYRLPQWGRAYACAACGEALGVAEESVSSIRLPKWLLGIGAVALFAGCVLALSMARSRDTATPGIAQPIAPQPLVTNIAVTQPEGVAQ